ncbi:hypothetical protein JTB14_001435 [Gonioctena quinquepunctata]|nr:hypothetical protein JTB14_001435 [Gonioctena quinquepunctata]
MKIQRDSNIDIGSCVRGYEMTISCAVVEKITSELPSIEFDSAPIIIPKVSLPLKQHLNDLDLGDSFFIAYKQFENLEELFSHYKSFIDEYVNLDHAKAIDLNSYDLKNDAVYFMAHHPVIRGDKRTTKLRDAFDGSMKTKNEKSLNYFLYNGAVVQKELFDILILFRTYEYVVSADIKQMYKMVLVDSNHTPLQHILWREDPSLPIQCLQLQTVTYGFKMIAGIRCFLFIANQSNYIIIHVIDVCISLVFMTSFMIVRICCSSIWERFPGTIMENFGSYQKQDKKIRDKAWTIWKIALSHSILLLTYVTYLKLELDSEHRMMESLNMEKFILWSIVTYCRFTSTHLFWELTNIMKIRYQNVTGMLKNTFSPEMRNLDVVKFRSKEIMSTYCQLNRSIKDLNVIFGGTIFINLGISILHLLFSVNISFQSYPAEFVNNLGLSSLSIAIFNSMMTAMVIFGCDKMENIGNEIITTCYLLQENMYKSPIADELSYLTEYLEHLTPTFTVAGLVRVNKKIFPSMLSITATYTIVIIQLYKQRSDQ